MRENATTYVIRVAVSPFQNHWSSHQAKNQTCFTLKYECEVKTRFRSQQGQDTIAESKLCSTDARRQSLVFKTGEALPHCATTTRSLLQNWCRYFQEDGLDPWAVPKEFADDILRVDAVKGQGGGSATISVGAPEKFGIVPRCGSNCRFQTPSETDNSCWCTVPTASTRMETSRYSEVQFGTDGSLRFATKIWALLSTSSNSRLTGLDLQFYRQQSSESWLVNKESRRISLSWFHECRQLQLLPSTKHCCFQHQTVHSIREDTIQRIGERNSQPLKAPQNHDRVAVVGRRIKVLGKQIAPIWS